MPCRCCAWRCRSLQEENVEHHGRLSSTSLGNVGMKLEKGSEEERHAVFTLRSSHLLQPLGIAAWALARSRGLTWRNANNITQHTYMPAEPPPAASGRSFGGYGAEGGGAPLLTNLNQSDELAQPLLDPSLYQYITPEFLSHTAVFTPVQNPNLPKDTE